MELNRNNIEAYIRRFMEGETTNEEERAIYHFFRSAEVPSHLKPYQAMFAWYEAGMPEDTKPKPHAVKKRFRILPIVRAGIAAMLVLLVGWAWMVQTDSEQEFACYEGSYVKVNGKCITDIEQIMPIILEVLDKTEKRERRLEERLAEIQRMEEYAAEKQRINVNF